jgi:hypothetical protein
VAGLLARLDGVVYRGKKMSIEIESTIVSDRGPSSGESTWGADFAVVGRIRGRNVGVRKAVLGQAKRGRLDDLRGRARAGFRSQVLRMNAATTALIGLEIPAQVGDMPRVRLINVGPIVPPRADHDVVFVNLFEPSGVEGPLVMLHQDVGLDEYLGRHLLPCEHGDAREGLVEGVGDSGLSPDPAAGGTQATRRAP